MKIIVFGSGEAPRGVRRVQTAQVATAEELYGLTHDLSGGEFVVVILRADDEATALGAARVAQPKPKVVLARGGQLREVVSAGSYQPFALTC